VSTARDLVKGAMKLLGVLRKGESPDADEATDGFTALNQMLASWSNENLICYARTRDSYTLTGASSYTIGSGATINTTKPVEIISAYVTTGSVDYPLTFINDEVYDQYVSYKSVTSSIPSYINYSNGHPNGTIRLWPIDTSGTVLHLLSEKAITQFTSLDTTVDLPTGWEKALKYGLALDIAPEYGIGTPPPSVIAGARESKGLIELSVAKARPMTALTPFTRRRNILTDR